MTIGLMCSILICSGVLPAPASVVESDAFTYLGAFRLPEGGERPFTFQYGGEAMTYCPSGDPSGSDDGFPGSLFVMGHNSMPYGELPDGNMVAEVSIPAPSVSSGVDGLSRSVILQDFSPVCESLFPGMDEIPRAGMEYLDSSVTGPVIHVCRGQHLEESASLTHGFFGADLSSSSVSGPWTLAGCRQYSANDYLFSCPPAWASSHTEGRMLLTGRYRDGGWGGMGPSLYAYSPVVGSGIAAAGASLSAVPLLQYRSSRETDLFEGCLSGYQHADEWTGGAWITDGSGGSAVLFAGTKGTGEYCWYGFVSSEGPSCPRVETEMLGEFTLCRDASGNPVDESVSSGSPVSMRGWWSSSFRGVFLLYDPSELAAVASGEMEPWSPQPYAVVDIDDVLFLPSGVEEEMLGSGVQRRFRLGDAAFDGENGLLYVLELFADDCAPVVHVWRVSG